jgi:protein dithiol:quinone oxidoreductase
VKPSHPLPFAALALLCLGAVGIAVALQYGMDMQPCPWCILQRVIFLAIAVFALLGLVWRGAAGQWIASLGALALALSGVAAALWQHFVSASSASCDLTLADRIVGALKLDALWPEVFTAYASCRDAAVDLIGLPFEFYSFALYVLIAAGSVMLMRRG